MPGLNEAKVFNFSAWEGVPLALWFAKGDVQNGNCISVPIYSLVISAQTNKKM